MGERRCACRNLVGRTEGSRPPGVGGRIILKWILKDYGEGRGLD
jgi:hypothetical protein